MLLDADDSQLVLVDYQIKLLPAMNAAKRASGDCQRGALGAFGGVHGGAGGAD